MAKDDARGEEDQAETLYAAVAEQANALGVDEGAARRLAAVFASEAAADFEAARAGLEAALAAKAAAKAQVSGDAAPDNQPAAPVQGPDDALESCFRRLAVDAVAHETDAIEKWRRLMDLQWEAYERGLLQGEKYDLVLAVALAREALNQMSRARAPSDWAMTQNNLGIALQRLGDRDADNARLEQAVDAYRAALEVYTRESAPSGWAAIKSNLGNALRSLGDRDADNARLEQAVDAHHAALEVYTREDAPFRWARTQDSLGDALLSLADRRKDDDALEQAIAAFAAALDVFTPDKTPLAFAATEAKLQRALRRGEPTPDETAKNATSGDETTGENADPTTSPASPTREPLRILSVATEWGSLHGGLSTFNRALCVGLTSAGHTVACYVLDATPEEQAAAEAQNVELIVASNRSYLRDDQRLFEKPSLQSMERPDVVIGHGRITGGAADSLNRNHFQTAKRLHFIHMAPDEIEPLKSDEVDRIEAAQERTTNEIELGLGAHRVVAVGPRLFNRFCTEFGAHDAPEPIQFDPGFDGPKLKDRRPISGDPWKILTLGRAEDWGLKGMDIAAAAISRVNANRPSGCSRLELVIRGAPRERAEQIRAAIADRSGARADEIVLRLFTERLDAIEADIRGASVVLMPSRKEGFGLTGLEAIVQGVPVLISDQSGLAELLQAHLSPEHCARISVPTSGENTRRYDEWTEAVRRVLMDRESAFEQIRDIRSTLAERCSWAGAINALTAALSDDPPKT
ncbi:MAG: glycosyltransferase [Pseudomonadota bacterium]